MRKFSVIIPVFNRPAEIDELLNSLVNQTYKDFEVLVIDDGSDQRSESITGSYKDKVISAVGENAYNRTLQKMPLTTSIDLALDYAMKTLLIGIPITIIISVLLRRQPKL